jgi:hypothetical protein
VVRTISRNFIPAAINQARYHGQPVEDRDAEGRLMERYRRGRDQYQGIWIVTTEGELLSAFVDPPNGLPHTLENMVRGLTEAIREALAKTGPLAPREVPAPVLNPDRGVSLLEDGSARLAVTVRPTHEGNPYGDPTVDSIILTAADLQALAPGPRRIDTRYPIAEEVARKFSRALSPISDLSTVPRPEDLTEVEMTGEVIARAGKAATVRLTGRLKGTRLSEGDASRRVHGRATLEGLAEFDEWGQLSRLLLLFEGAFQWPPPYHDPAIPTGALVEWRSQ